MKMPASFAEFSDALQKARIKDGSFCKNELTCIHYNGLTHAMIGWNANLYDLNLFAQRLASLTEEQKKGMDALLKIKQNHRVAPIPLNQLINLTYNTDICCFAPRVSNHEELGAFLYANEMLSNEAILLVFMYDRLGRNLNETPFIAEWFTKKGIHVWSVYEGEIIDGVDAERMLDYIRFWQTDEAQKL